ncbi:TonB-dependent receptor [Oceanicoccus sp. KOV_DT_Chl]|uniref:TonB-dependent receptor n=1 Tax=Oceanicoccus sp. KOV_DT_Chl TaxID=1904639 RepID=UPI000C7E6761|nr:TonB-dependent receptor [Oceanicoccus sp. KOV_DT_Chl]
MSRQKSNYVPLVSAALLSSLSPFSPLTAEELVLEEILVTAQIRTESLQDVPVSVSAVSGSKLMEAGIDKIEDLQAYVPNLTMSETGIGTNIYIRGIGSGINQGFEQSTGMYIDGVSYGRAQLSRAPFLDLERVEVLRGPQNILFGKNSISGALSIITAKPSSEFEGSVTALYEPEHGEEIFDLVLNGGLTDNLSARLAYRSREMDGYMENIFSGDDEPGRDEETIRLAFALDVNENLDLSLKVEHGEFDVTGRQIEIVNEEPGANNLTYSQLLVAGFGADASVLNNEQDYKRTSNGDSSENETDSITFTANYALGEGTLTFITGLLEYEYDEVCDCDFTGATIFSLRSQEEYEQISQEIRFTSPVGETWEYIGGLYYQSSELVFNDRITLDSNSILPAAVNAGFAAFNITPGDLLVNTAVPREFTTDTDIYSAFLQATWNVRDDLRLTFGGRYTEEEKDGSRELTYTDLQGNELPFDYGSIFSAQPFGVDAVYGLVFKVDRHNLKDSRNEQAFSPSILVEYDINPDMMMYANISQGSKSGGFDARSNADPAGSPPEFPAAAAGFGYFPNVGTFEYEDEKATSFELGAKTTLMDGAAELNVALFYTEYEDLQVSIFDGTLGFNVGNAGEAETYGLELDGRWRVTESFTVSGSLAYLDFEFTDYAEGQCNFGETPNSPSGNNCDYKGRTNQYVADWSGSLTGNYFTTIGDSLTLSSSLDLIFTDDYNPTQTLDPGMDQDGYVKVNARIAISDINANWEVALIGKNLTDEEIMTYGNQTPLAGTSFDVASRYAFYERSKSVAVQGVYRF